MTLVPSISPNRPPTGGKWQYRVDGVTLEAATFDELLAKAEAHLLPKMYATQEIRQFILAQEKVRCPWLVSTSEDEITLPRHQLAYRNYVRSIGESEYLEDDDFNKRAPICRACPHNIPLEVNAEAQRNLYLLTRGKPHELLGFCDFHKQPNAIACMIEKYQRYTGSNGPLVCWMNEEPPPLES